MQRQRRCDNMMAERISDNMYTHTHTHGGAHPSRDEAQRSRGSSQINLPPRALRASAVEPFVMAAVISIAALSSARTTTAMPIPQDGPPATKYLVIEIGPLGDFFPSTGPTDAPNADAHGTMGINNLGEVVYSYEDTAANEVHAFVWLPNDNPSYINSSCGFYDLNDLINPDEPTIARDINDAGQVVGQIGDTLAQEGTTGNSRGILWDLAAAGSGGASIDHQTIPAFNGWSAAHAINNDATPLVVGTAMIQRPCECETGTEDIERTAAFTWRLGDTNLTELEPLSGASQAEARDVNMPTGQPARSDVAGRSFCTFYSNPATRVPVSQQGLDSVCVEGDCGLSTRAIGWEEQTATGDELPLLSMDDYEHAARGINDAGNVVGFGRIAVGQDCDRRALFWDSPGSGATLENLGATMPSANPDQTGDESRAEAINNMCMAQVVGWNEARLRALRWNRRDDGSWDVLDLTNALRSCDANWIIRQAHDINDDGWIACWGIPVEGGTPDFDDRRALLLIPVPPGPGDTNGDYTVDIDDLNAVIANWDPEGDPGCAYRLGDVTGDGIVDLDDLNSVISNWGSTVDPCEFDPELDCGPSQSMMAGGGGSSLMSGSSTMQSPFADVLEAYGFENWVEAMDWLRGASAPDVLAFLAALSNTNNGED